MSNVERTWQQSKPSYDPGEVGFCATVFRPDLGVVYGVEGEGHARCHSWRALTERQVSETWRYDPVWQSVLRLLDSHPEMEGIAAALRKVLTP